MATSSYLYPYDPSGTESTNKIVAENHTVQPPNNISDASFIIPRAAPFFGDSIIIRKGPTEDSERLEEGVDYYLTHNFVTLSYVLAKPIYGSIAFINRNFTGDVFITYQTVGGDYVLDSYSIIEERTRSLYSVFMVTWEQVAGNFPQLPPYDHKMSGDDVLGFSAVVDSINNLAAIIASGGGTSSGSGSSSDGSFPALQAHINANTAHTKSQVGLGNVDNYKTANEADVVALSVRTFMTPAMTKYYLDNTVFVSQLQVARADITDLKTRTTTNESNININKDAVALINQSLTLMATNQDTMREDIDNLVADVATSLAPFETLPSDVNRHTTEITDLLNRVGLLETAKTTQAAALSSLSSAVDTVNTSIAKLMTLFNFVPRILTPSDNVQTFTVAAGRKISLLLVAIENHTVDAVTEVKLYQLTNSKGVRRSAGIVGSLTPTLTVGSNKATPATNGSVKGYTYTVGTVSAANGVVFVNHSVSGRVPNHVDNVYGDTIQKIPDLMINTTAYPVSANAIYNEATPAGVPSTGIAEMTYENTNAFDVTFIISGTYLVAAIQDITTNPAPADLPITIVYPT